MSTGRIMTLSVESLNKLYFQFIEVVVSPHLNQPLPEVAQLLKQRTAYEVHRYLEDVLAKQVTQPLTPSEHFSTQTNSSANHSTSPFQYALVTDQNKPFDVPYPKDKSSEDKSYTGKMGMRKAMTGLAFEERAYDHKHSHDDNLMSIPNLNDHKDHKEEMTPTPSLTPSAPPADHRFDKPQSRDKSLKLLQAEQAVPRSKLMREAVKKISRLFNDNHSKIQKYSKKGDPNTKLFNLNVSTKLQKREEGLGVKYQFHTRTDSHSRY